MTLSSPSVEVELDAAEQLSIRSFEHGGEERVLKEKDLARIHTYLNLCSQYLQTLGADLTLNNLDVTIRSAIPPAIGLASSAAVFSALAESLAAWAKDHSGRELTRKEVSVLARFGSGSASRSIFGGFSSMLAGTGSALDSAYAKQVSPADHWKLHDVIVVPNMEEKKIGSTEGHALAGTSPLFQDRIADIPRRMRECTDAIRERDFNKLQHIAEFDSLDMHKVMETSTPSIQYLNDETPRIMKDIEDLRTREHLEVLYTMDAGPTVHLVCSASALPHITAYAEAQKARGCTIFLCSVGTGSHLNL